MKELLLRKYTGVEFSVSGEPSRSSIRGLSSEIYWAWPSDFWYLSKSRKGVIMALRRRSVARIVVIFLYLDDRYMKKAVRASSTPKCESTM